VAHRLPDRVAPLEDALRGKTAADATRGRPPDTVARVPLRARGQDFGSMTLLRDERSRTFDELDRDTARELGLRSAFAIENARLYQQAQDSIRARDEFLAIAAHELKTPLSPLRVQAQALVRALDRGLVLPPEKLRARLSAIDRATARLERLTDTLLEISEVTVGRLLLHRAPVDLAEVAKTVVERLRVPFERAGSPVLLSVAPAVGSWDARRLEQACEHLLLNAAKYGAGHPIEVTVEADAATARLTVLDHGMGIAVAEQVHLFERFQRRAPLRHFGGFGLGLWVVRQIAEAHGGSVHLWSRPGLGARFSLELPRGPVAQRSLEPDEEPVTHA
jgi:signal transduction histidine kinase